MSLQIESADKAFTAHIGWRLMGGPAWYNEDESTLGDGTELCRMRVLGQGTVYADWQHKNQIDSADNKVSIKAPYYIADKWLKPAAFTVGNFKVPVSLDSLTRSRFITFMKRAPINRLTVWDYLGFR